MRKFWVLAILAAVVTSVMFVNVAMAADQQIIKVGKKGEIMFDKETKIGDITLKPGHYEIQHRVEGSDHFVHFTEFKGMHRFSGSVGPTGVAQAGEVKCNLETLPGKASQTQVMLSTADGERRITRIEIAGETVAHVF